ncbi:HTH cro/C1-type domain-containing protein OS=Streptomyces fumanus OX=67302 GN=GCM10018772_14870 PE=4 SV=1 [Streptomyces fumanus]|uniref:HTH cro/C1-type domain-containing protein n=1 Tax=Streptomyces fumanus TaxID=67302 RepID=A0A919DWL9_9ACTN|nr:hypothetical protein GCM10018772_14870 [Streptomyces fumanus]
MARQELARYLRKRRAALRPHEIGLAETGTARRTPGLRREEVAELAHMSVDYYTRLEQARGPRPSARILDALARALRLAPAERSHLFRLAGSSAPPGTSAVRWVRPHVARMLERLPETGAIVTDAAYHVVAWNPLARHCSAATSETGRRTWPAAASWAGGGRTRVPAPRKPGKQPEMPRHDLRPGAGGVGEADGFGLRLPVGAMIAGQCVAGGSTASRGIARDTADVGEVEDRHGRRPDRTDRPGGRARRARGVPGRGRDERSRPAARR